ncbi:MAG: Gfo/Idh/MocA family protein [Thermomicrobiales bacterium]
MTEPRIRVALIGAGTMANTYHYPSLASFPDVDLVAICDLVEEKARQTAARFGIPADRVYRDYRQMVAEVQPGAVYVLMPPQHLYEPVHHLLEQGCHLFIEKPLALTLTQARMLSYTAEQHGCLTMVGFQRRFIPAMTTLRERVESRGPIHSATVDFLKNTGDLTKPAGFYDGAIDPLTSDGIHAIDTLRWLCGGEVEAVHVEGRRRYVPGPAANAFSALVSFSTGAVGGMQYNTVTGRRIFRAEFHSPNATASVDADRDSLFVADGGEPDIQPSAAFARAVVTPEEELAPRHWLGFWHENRHFIDRVTAGLLPSSHFGDAVKSMELAERILLAARDERG